MRNLREVAGVSIAVLVFAASSRAAAQDRPLPASPTPPPEEQERQRASQPPVPPPASPTVDQLLQQLRITRADIDRRKAARETPLPASPQEPPEERERRMAAEPPVPPRSRTLQELIDVVRRQPGGAEILDRARRGGASIPPGSDDTDDGAGGFRGGFAQSEGALEADRLTRLVQDTLKVTKTNQSASATGLGSLTALPILQWYTTSPTSWGYFKKYTWPNSYIGSVDLKPHMYVTVNVATAGYYLLNVVATATSAELRKSGTCCPNALVPGGQWDNMAASGYSPYPILLNLAAGWHYFYWLPTNTDGRSVWVSEVTLRKL